MTSSPGEGNPGRHSASTDEPSADAQADHRVVARDPADRGHDPGHAGLLGDQGLEGSQAAHPGDAAVGCRLSGFGFRTRGGAGRPVHTVTPLADSGPGSLRDALSKADRDGGTIRFAVGGRDRAPLGAGPNRVTIDGSSAPAPGITLLGERAGAGGTGVLNLYHGNVIVRGLRIRNAMNDGIHIVPRRSEAIANVVVWHGRRHSAVTNLVAAGVAEPIAMFGVTARCLCSTRSRWSRKLQK